MHFIKLSPTELVQFDDNLSLLCTHRFCAEMDNVPATYTIDRAGDYEKFLGESALSLYEYFFNYQNEMRNVMSVEELRLDTRLVKKLEQQRRISDLNYELAEHEMLVTRARMNQEREQILESQARSLYPGKKLVS